MGGKCGWCGKYGVRAAGWGGKGRFKYIANGIVGERRLEDRIDQGPLSGLGLDVGDYRGGHVRQHELQKVADRYRWSPFTC